MTGRPVVTLVRIQDRPLSVDEVLAAVSRPDAGAVVTFLGMVRDHDHGSAVTRLDYEAHPDAESTLRAVLAEVAGQDGVLAVAACHRTGHLQVGELAVVAAVSAAHRTTAFEACRRVIERLKESVPLWKRQWHSDGSSQWLGLR